MKKEHADAIVGFIRRLQPADLYLPIGAALVSHGLQVLVNREARQRERLRALDEIVGANLDALAAAAVVVPAGLVRDERHPLDVENAIGSVLLRQAEEADYGIAENPNPKKRRLRPLVLLALAGVAGVTLLRKGGVVEDIVYAARGGDVDVVQPAEPPAAAEILEDSAAADDEAWEACGWDGCGYGSAHSATLALHRNECGYRPSNAHVPE